MTNNPLKCFTVLVSLIAQVTAWGQVNFLVKGATVNLNGSVYVTTNSLSLATGGKLNVNNSTIKIAGAVVTSAGTFTAVNGTVMMNGSYAQSVPAASFAGNAVKNLVIGNTSGVTLNGPLSVTDVLTVSAGSFLTGGFLTLTSTAASTARVAPVTSNAATPINGNVTVERYVPGRRSYRLITSSVTTSTAAVLTAGQEQLSIWGNWQNSGNNVVQNAGTFITGGSSADGFDQQITNPSLFTYNNVTRQFTAFSSANGKNTKYTPLKAGTAYYIFVYGDRLNSVITSSPNNTVLRATGTLLTGTQTYNSGSAVPLSTVTGRYTLLGNPFASPIDWTSISGTDLSNTYWGWDPNLSSTGGYVTVSKTGTVVLIAPFSGTVGLNQYIQSGQGFFVQTTGPSPSMTIREVDKAAVFNSKAFRTGNTSGTNDVPLLAINLLYDNAGNRVLADGTLAAFDEGFSKEIGNEDAAKIENGTESIGISHAGQLLSIEGRPMPADKDTLFLSTARLTRPQYSLQIFARQMDGGRVTAYLHDTYLNSIQPLSLTDTNTIAFNINLAESASYSTNRFHIVFSAASVLPVTFTSVSAEPKNGDIEVDWHVAGETGILQYEVEHAADGMHFTKKTAVPARNSHSAESYRWLHRGVATGSNYYRIRALQADGSSIVSKVVNVKTGTAGYDVKVFPNPVTNKQITVQTNSVEAGRYTLSLYNATGEQIMKRTVGYAAGLSNEVIYFDKKLPAGLYRLQIDGENMVYRQFVFVE